MMVPSVSAAAAALRAATVAAAPQDAILSAQPRAVIDQALVPCCVSCSLASAMEVKHPGWPRLAPLFHYYVTRYERGGADPDGRLRLPDALRALTAQGICRLADHAMEYDAAGASTRPSPTAYADGRKRRLESDGVFFRYKPLSGVSRAVAVRDALRKDWPVVIGLYLPPDYPNGTLGARREWVDPASPAPTSAGHCVLAVGFSDARQAFRIHDSQGAGRFDEGRWWLGYRVADSRVIADAYALT